MKNEKYAGDVRVLKSKDGSSFLMSDAHPAIVSKGIFYAAQDQRKKRTNIDITVDGNKRKNTKYSSKKAIKIT